MAILEFQYDNSTKAITATADCLVSFSLYGGGGGGGGNDSHPGSYGTDGGVVHGTITLKKDQTIYCTVGQGGQAGASGRSGAAGGTTKGYARDGFSGGIGGRAGWSGSSGGGGQGGGATVLALTPPPLDGQNNRNLTPTPDSELIAVAAGGGGGGGGGNVGAANGTLYSTSPYGTTTPFLYKYYTPAATNGAYCSFLNSYGVWNGNGRYTWDVYFPSSTTYTIELSADNYAYAWLDNGANGDDDYIGDTPNGSRSAFDRSHTFTKYVTAGWHTIDLYAYNYGGPASLGARISSSTTGTIWTTLSSYNRNSPKHKGRGGAGFDKGGDGGGSGGGGGGHFGGRGGDLRGGDQGAYSGSKGYNFTSSTVDTNSPVLSAPSGNVYGTGGSNTSDGVNGGAIFDVVMSQVNVRQTVNNTPVWKMAKKIYRRNSFNIFGFRYVYWSEVEQLNVKDNGVWKQLYGSKAASWVTQAVGQNTNWSGPTSSL